MHSPSRSCSERRRARRASPRHGPLTASHAQAARGSRRPFDRDAARRVSTAGSTACSARFIASCPSCPRLVHFPRVAVPAEPRSRGASFVSQPAAAPAPRTIYVRAKAPPASAQGTSTTATASPTEVATMTNHVARLYALAISLIVFFAVWLAVSAHPWSRPRPRSGRRSADGAPGGARAPPAGRDARGST